jgi:hypothetical protein
MTAALHAVSHDGDLTAGAALAWFASPGAAASGSEVIGYLYAPDRAEWFRWDGTQPTGPDGPRDLTAAWELTATDGRRHLRWTHRQSGTGPAVSLSEDPHLLPAGDPVPACQPRTRLDGTSVRMLAGQVMDSGDGWATLRSARYARAHVPATAENGQEIWAELAEYAVTDDHGNRSVVDTLLTGLRPQQPAKERRP